MVKFSRVSHSLECDSVCDEKLLSQGNQNDDYIKASCQEEKCDDIDSKRSSEIQHRSLCDMSNRLAGENQIIEEKPMISNKRESHRKVDSKRQFETKYRFKKTRKRMIEGRNNAKFNSYVEEEREGNMIKNRKGLKLKDTDENVSKGFYLASDELHKKNKLPSKAERKKSVKKVKIMQHGLPYRRQSNKTSTCSQASTMYQEYTFSFEKPSTNSIEMKKIGRSPNRTTEGSEGNIMQYGKAKEQWDEEFDKSLKTALQYCPFALNQSKDF